MQELRTSEQSPLYETHRSFFPVTQNLIYLNHAAVAPLVKPAAEAMTALSADACHFGSFHYDRWLEAYEKLRVAAASLMNASRSEIAIVKNTSEGIATVALGIDWRQGDKIVAFREEFPANYFPWIRLQAKGVRIEWRSINDPLNAIDESCRGARLLAISFVNYLSGYRIDLEAIGEICRRRGTLFFVDAIQGLGAFPLDVQRAGIHALSADGHKWLLGPEGCGVLYIRQDLQEQVEPVEFGWTNVRDYADYASRDMTLRPDAGRYECGTLNTIGCFGLCAAIEFLNKAGIERIAGEVLDRSRRIAEGVLAKGYELLAPWSRETASGIVSFRRPDLDSRLAVKRLRERKIVAAPRQGWIRASPHFYISPADIDAALAELP